MAERKATLILELKDQATKGLKSLVDVYAGLKIVTEAYQQTLGRLKDFLLDSLEAFAQNERSVKALENALKNQGFYSKEYSRSLQEQATALQNVSTFSDEAILDTQTLLTTFGLAGTKLDETTKAAMDLATGLGVDLRTATLLLGKAWAGETATLGRYGIKISETLTGAKAFDAVLAQVNGRFGGRSADDAETYTGKVANLANRWDDVKERIGSFLVGPAIAVVNWMKDATIVADYLLVKMKDLFSAGKVDLAKSLDEVNRLLKEMGDPANDRGHIAIKNRNDLLERQSELVKQLAEQQAQAAAAPIPQSRTTAGDDETAALAKKLQDQSDLEEFALAESARKKIESLSMTQAQLDQMNVQNMAQDLQRQGMHEEAKNLLALQARKNAEERTKQMHVGLVSSLQAMTVLANAKTKELALVGKAAAVAMAVINAHRGYALALGTIPPPYGFVVGSLVLAAGYAQAAMISGVNLAEGGMLTAKPGGVKATMAEAGHDEVAIPLDDDRTKERLRDTFSGGENGGHYHFHIGTLVSDKDEFIRWVDERLFKLKQRGGAISL